VFAVHLTCSFLAHNISTRTAICGQAYKVGRPYLRCINPWNKWRENKRLPATHWNKWLLQNVVQKHTFTC